MCIARKKGRNHRGSQKILEMDENKNTECQHLWNTAKAVLKGKFMAIDAYIKNKRISEFPLWFSGNKLD